MMGNDSRRHSIMQMHLHRYAYHSLLVLLILAVGLLIALPTMAATLTAEQAYQKGKTLHFQDRFEEAEPYLLQAGNSGNAAAYYLIADSGSFNRFGMSDKEYKFMKFAADNGHLLAMVGMISDRSLTSPKEKKIWREKFLEVVEPEINKGNPLAYELISRLYVLKDEYFGLLKNSAYAGYPSAQWEVARRFEMGDDWFLLPGSREKEVAKLYEASARGGYRDALSSKALSLIEEGEKEKAFEIINTLIDKGDAQSLTTYGALFSDIYPNSLAGWSDIDKARGASYLKALKDSMAPESKNGLYRDMYRFAEEDLSDEEIKQGEILAEEYLRTHTVYRQDGLDEYEYTVDNLHTALERWGGNAIE
ncbi:hypothetical protein [Enterovibrio norvegicus]|uniref:hypothetical protein n=1 Tax=Enterovibrio norvegicus TaxID=188144 RepID=UPI0024B0FFE8|nr:hypothetical protein [Enterovibrio norvegicus]